MNNTFVGARGERQHGFHASSTDDCNEEPPSNGSSFLRLHGDNRNPDPFETPSNGKKTHSSCISATSSDEHHKSKGRKFLESSSKRSKAVVKALFRPKGRRVSSNSSTGSENTAGQQHTPSDSTLAATACSTPIANDKREDQSFPVVPDSAAIPGFDRMGHPSACASTVPEPTTPPRFPKLPFGPDPPKTPPSVATSKLNGIYNPGRGRRTNSETTPVREAQLFASAKDARHPDTSGLLNKSSDAHNPNAQTPQGAAAPTSCTRPQRALLTDEGEDAGDAVTRYQLGIVNLRNGDLEEAADNFGRALRARKRMHGRRDEAVAAAYEMLGDVAVLRRDHQRVHLNYDAAVDILGNLREGGLGSGIGKRNAIVARILQKKAKAHLSCGENDSAVSCLSNAFVEITARTCERSGGVASDKDSALGAIDVLVSIGCIYVEQGKYDSALKTFTKALERATDGKFWRYVVVVLRHKGGAHMEIDDVENALESYSKALEVIEKESCFGFLERIDLCERIIKVHRGCNNEEQIISWYERMLGIATKDLGQNRDAVATIYCELGCYYREINRYSEALRCFKAEYRVRSSNGSDHKYIGVVCLRLGAMCHSVGNNKEALACYGEALDHFSPEHSSDQADGPNRYYSIDKHALLDRLQQCEGFLKILPALPSWGDNPVTVLKARDVANAVNDMGNIYLLDASFCNAIHCYSSSLRMNLLEEGFSQLDRWRIESNLGKALYRYKAYSEAMTIFEKLLQDEVMDQDSIWKANILHEMGNVHLERKRYLDAIQCYERSVQIKRRTMDESHREVLNSKYNMGVALYHLGKYESALKELQEVLCLQRKGLGGRNVVVANTGSMVGSICAKMEIYGVALEHLESSLETSRYIFGANHRSVGNALGRIAAVHLAQHHRRAARQLCLEALTVFDAAGIESNHKDVLTVTKMLRKANKVTPQPRSVAVLMASNGRCTICSLLTI